MFYVVLVLLMLRDHFGVVEIPYLVFVVVRTIGARLIKNIVGKITKWNVLSALCFIGICWLYVIYYNTLAVEMVGINDIDPM